MIAFSLLVMCAIYLGFNLGWSSGYSAHRREVTAHRRK